MNCFCASYSSHSGIGEPLLYLQCMARVTNFQLMERFDEVNRRIDGQDETLKSMVSSLAELTSAVKSMVITYDKKEVNESEPDVSLIMDEEKSDTQLNDDGEEGESSSAIKGENDYITHLSKNNYEEKRIDNADYTSTTIIKDSDKDKTPRFTPEPDLITEIASSNSTDSLIIWKMSGYPHNQGNYAVGKSNGWRKQTNAGPKPNWKPKTKVSVDEYFGSASSCQKVDSSLTSECTSHKISSFTHKQDLHIHSQKESSSPLVKNTPFGKENFNIGGIVDKRKRIGDILKQEDTDHAFSITRFDICPNKVNTGSIKIKTSLLVKNREKRNQIKRVAEGPNINILRPGMVLLKGYISLDDQVKIVKTCRELGISEGGFYQPGYSNGAKLHLKMMCLGKNWDPQSSEYNDIRQIDNSKPQKIPDYFHDMVKKALQDSNLYIQKSKGKIIPSMLPDICIVKFYAKDGKLGLHQDKDESKESLDKGLPVVSFSVGESAEFLYGKERDIEKAEKVKLESGDVLIFGGESRNIFHGVSSIGDDTAPKMLLEGTDMRPGRLNLTFRQY